MLLRRLCGSRLGLWRFNGWSRRAWRWDNFLVRHGGRRRRHRRRFSKRLRRQRLRRNCWHGLHRLLRRRHGLGWTLGGRRFWRRWLECRGSLNRWRDGGCFGRWGLSRRTRWPSLNRWRRGRWLRDWLRLCRGGSFGPSPLPHHIDGGGWRQWLRLAVPFEPRQERRQHHDVEHQRYREAAGNASPDRSVAVPSRQCLVPDEITHAIGTARWRSSRPGAQATSGSAWIAGIEVCASGAAIRAVPCRIGASKDVASGCRQTPLTTRDVSSTIPLASNARPRSAAEEKPAPRGGAGEAAGSPRRRTAANTSFQAVFSSCRAHTLNANRPPFQRMRWASSRA
jgi:hypothetical protein